MEFTAKGSSMDSKNYLRLKDGESVVGLFAGTPYNFRVHWSQNKTVLCSEDNLCELCNRGGRSVFKFRLNLITKEDNQYVAKIFEQGWTVYEALQQLNSTYDLDKYLVKISRRGSGQHDTTYSILPMPNGEISPDLAKTLASIPLHNLKQHHEAPKIETNSSTTDNSWAPVPAFDSNEELPF